VTRRKLRIALVLSLVVATRAPAQTIQAVRVSGAAPHVDGRLDETVWRSAPAITSFTQREPDEGAPAPERTDVRIAYDDDALYIGARMFSEHPADIRALVTRRDQEGTSERINISLDTYRDRRTAYTFAVTAAGVRIDYVHTSDSEGDRAYEYNPVWDAAVRIDSVGWTAEMRIPFTQLRFSPRDVQEWGINVARHVPARNEQSYWVLVRRNETGWSSRMATLTGIRGIRPSRRIEAIPYVAASSTYERVEDAADPFAHPTYANVRGGGDLKMGLGPNLTLDMTLNPDFGQVEADPAVVNLSAYEIFFDERRPFFTEGSDLLDRRGLFYSRRIGAPPPGSARSDYAEQIGNTTILGAAKLTGRLPSGLSVAGLAALTDAEHVRTFDITTHAFGHALVAPRTGYAAASVQQEFGEDASTLGGMLTWVHRDVDAGTPLGNLLARDAVTGIGEGRYRWAGGKYDVNAWWAVTGIQGDSLALVRQQRSSRRYFQRPDDYRVDSSLRSMQGMYVGVGHSKLAGKHWLWDIDYNHQSPTFEGNDLGAFSTADNRSLSTEVRWRETTPRAWYRRYVLGVDVDNNWSYSWLPRGRNQQLYGDFTFRNFWQLNLDVERGDPSFSDRQTRGGPIMGMAGYRSTSIELRNSSTARYRWGVEWGVSESLDGGWQRGWDFSLSARPGDRWDVSLNTEWTRGQEGMQYVATIPTSGGSTYGNRYVFALLDGAEGSARLRVNYLITPRLTLETYAEPFASSGRFHLFGELAAPRSRSIRRYGTDGTTIDRNPDGTYTVTDGAETFDLEPEDYNVRSFRSNAVLRWEWRPGSTLFLVWQQDRSADRALRLARPVDLWDALDTTGSNFLAIKISYWTSLR